MTLILALLREDHVIFAADRRHVAGDQDSRYRRDDCWKSEKILNGTAMLGFSGHDLSEQIVLELKRTNALEIGDLRMVAAAVSKVTNEKVGQYNQGCAQLPTVEFLLAGFVDGNVATAFTVKPPDFSPFEFRFNPIPEQGQERFAVIGKRKHGALYVFYKCATDAMSVEAGIRLACFALMEVGTYDIMVCGRPQVCVMRPGQKVEDRSDQLATQIQWVKDASEEIRKIMIGLTPPA